MSSETNGYLVNGFSVTQTQILSLSAGEHNSGLTLGKTAAHKAAQTLQNTHYI